MSDGLLGRLAAAAALLVLPTACLETVVGKPIETERALTMDRSVQATPMQAAQGYRPTAQKSASLEKTLREIEALRRLRKLQRSRLKRNRPRRPFGIHADPLPAAATWLPQAAWRPATC